MRDRPDLSELRIAACLRQQYGLEALSAQFLPLGYDPAAWVYRVAAADGASYFVKVRAGALGAASLLVRTTLIEGGVPNILAPLRTRAQELCCALDGFTVVVYPFIQGENAWRSGLSESQWVEFGATLGAIHSGGFADLLRGHVPVETFAIPSAELVRRLMASLPADNGRSPAMKRMLSVWRERLPLIRHAVERAEALGKQLQGRPFERVLCHADIHPGNILVSEAGQIYLIDWDGPLIAPRERDLLFVVGARIGQPVNPREEELFFRGYGPADADGAALAYYRYERFIEDIGVITQGMIENREQSEESRESEVEMALSFFRPGNILAAAMEMDAQQGGPPGPTAPQSQGPWGAGSGT